MCAFHHSWQPTTSFKLQKSMCMYAWMYVNNCCTYDDSDNKKIGMQLNFYNYQTNKQIFWIRWWAYINAYVIIKKLKNHT